MQLRVEYLYLLSQLIITYPWWTVVQDRLVKNASLPPINGSL